MFAATVFGLGVLARVTGRGATSVRLHCDREVDRVTQRLQLRRFQAVVSAIQHVVLNPLWKAGGQSEQKLLTNRRVRVYLLALPEELELADRVGMHAGRLNVIACNSRSFACTTAGCTKCSRILFITEGRRLLPSPVFYWYGMAFMCPDTSLRCLMIPSDTGDLTDLALCTTALILTNTRFERPVLE